MKRRIVLLIAIGLMGISAKSQDIITKTNGDELKVQLLGVGVDSIFYKMFDNLDGPTLSLPATDIATLQYSANSSQRITPTHTTADTAKPSGILPRSALTDPITILGHTYYNQGKRLTSKQVAQILSDKSTPEIVRQFGLGTQKRKIGDICAYSGYGIIMGGAISFVCSRDVAGLWVALGGCVVMSVAIPFQAVGKVQQKRSVVQYNQGLKTPVQTSCNFGFTPNGLGWVLKF
ncbi:MAG: hypothetical protein WCQ95_14120 [Bacteroidota bacterium]